MGLAYARIAGEERHLAMEIFRKSVDILSCSRRYAHCVVSDTAVEVFHSLEQTLILRIAKEVYLIEDKQRGHAVSLGGSQETVDKRKRSGRMRERSHQHRTIDIGRYDVCRFRQIACPADDIIAPGYLPASG